MRWPWSSKPKPITGVASMARTTTLWWVDEIKGGRVRLTFDLYWMLNDLAMAEGYSTEQWREFKLEKPVRDLVTR